MKGKLSFRDNDPSEHPEDVGCILKSLGREHTLSAAKTAVEENPANRPNLRGLSTLMSEDALCEVMKPQAIALLTSKYWGPGGKTLSVSFMETTVPELRDKIISHMNAWNKFCGVNFVYSQAAGDVRISRGQGGYWSYLGTDIQHIPSRQQTMNLEGFTLKTPESEYKRVIRHETGHTLGFPHEHMRKEIVSLLDPAKTIAYFERTQGWSAQEIQDQVLTPLSDASIMGTPSDVNSIMCYQLPGEITTSGQPIPGGLDIDDSDAAFAAKIYPKAGAPPVNPNGGNGGAKPSGLVTLDVIAKVATLPTGWSYKQG